MPDALMVTSSFLPGRGGIESYLSELCALLKPRIAVMAPAERDGKGLPTGLGYPTIAGPGSMLVPGKRTLEAVTRAAEDLGVRRILFGTPWPLALLGPQLKRRGYNYASTAFGAELFVPAAAPLIRNRLRRALLQADLLLPMSDFTETKLRALLPKGALPQIEVMRARVDLERFRPGVDTSQIRARLGLAPGAKVILSFGRLVARKGAHRLIEALPRIARAVPEACLVVAGTGPREKSLRRLALGANGRVVFAGRVPDQDAPALFAAADVFAFPVVDRWFGLDTEGLGVVLLEAAACETPCVTGQAGGSVEAVNHDVTGLIVDAADEEGLAGALISILRDPTMAARMGKEGRAFVSSRYAPDHLPVSLLRWLD